MSSFGFFVASLAARTCGFAVTRVVAATTLGAACLLVTVDVATAAPTALSTPAGVTPGSYFRFLFVTSGTTAAGLGEGSITPFNNFVTADAGGATYNGVAVTWKAVASAFSVDARVNVGGLNTAVPIYLPSGVKVADNMSIANGLWSGSLLQSPAEYLDGSAVAPGSRVWTGSLPDGLKAAETLSGFDEPPVARYGIVTTSTGWLSSANDSVSSSYPLYGLSEPLQAVVPEPSTYAMALAGLVCGGFSVWRRRKRS